MKKLPPFPEIPADEQTPYVVSWLGIMEKLRETIQQQEEEIGRLKDEIALLKGEKARPKIKPSRMEAEQDGGNPDSSGNQVPPGRDSRGFAVPGLCTVCGAGSSAGNLQYAVSGGMLANPGRRLPAWGTAGMKATVPYPHHHGRMTQPLLKDLLNECGIDSSTGQIDALLHYGQDGFLQEKQAILQAGLEVSSASTVDDTGARHPGKNGYTTQIGNDFFAWFETTDQKSRVTFLRLLQAGRQELRLPPEALDSMARQNLSALICLALAEHPVRPFEHEAAWQAHLQALEIITERHVRIATEGLLVGQWLQDPLWQHLALVSDDAGQFASCCWC